MEWKQAKYGVSKSLNVCNHFITANINNSLTETDIYEVYVNGKLIAKSNGKIETLEKYAEDYIKGQLRCALKKFGVDEK